ncbi:MAG: ribosome small subunit-dependent GTPase A [Gammaproteobacteria bacterium]|nr:ribosome small subunit-dependent GTPase A [Gammaproteobacteria bacterium]
MAKRRLSRQQKNRIQAAQQAFSASHDQKPGLVVSHRGGRILVELDATETIECKIKSNLGTIVCGDRVTIETTAQSEHRVMGILARDNLLQRVDGFGQVRAVAANISQLFVCLAVSPRPNLFLLDQYLLSAEQQNIDAIILLNKIDLAADERDPFGLQQIYRPLGYRIVATSATSGAGMNEFESLLIDQVSVLSGVSGVGKSSLTSWLLPDEKIKIAQISAANAEGRHTTRASRLYHLPSGGDLIDTPGVRGFSPFVDRDTPLALGFREIRDRGEHCRFHNCLHRNEPSCAVIAAVESGEMSVSRYQNYLKMLESGAGC